MNEFGDQSAGYYQKPLREIKQFSQAASRHLARNDGQAALRSLRHAYRLACQIGDPTVMRAASFNLGAALIALGRPADGLRELNKSLPPGNRRDGVSNGDLYYNQYIAYEQLGNKEETLRCLTLAHKEYLLESDNIGMQISTANKLAELHELAAASPELDHEETKRKEQLNLSVKYYQDAERFLSQTSDQLEERISAMVNLISVMLKAGQKDEAMRKLQNCSEAIRGMINNEKKDLLGNPGHLLNEIGLLFMQCNNFKDAFIAFTEAHSLAKGLDDQAYARQNMGAAANALRRFIEAVTMSEEAAKMHGRLGNRTAEMHCFSNIGFGLFEQKKYVEAAQNYLHSLQLARDLDDQVMESKCLESLGDIAYTESQVEQAVDYFKSSLSLVSNNELVRRNRLISKLEQSIARMHNRISALGLLSQRISGTIQEEPDEENDSEDSWNQRICEHSSCASISDEDDETDELSRRRKHFCKRKDLERPILSQTDLTMGQSFLAVSDSHQYGHSHRSQHEIENSPKISQTNFGSIMSNEGKKPKIEYVSEKEEAISVNKARYNLERNINKFATDTPAEETLNADEIEDDDDDDDEDDQDLTEVPKESSKLIETKQRLDALYYQYVENQHEQEVNQFSSPTVEDSQRKGYIEYEDPPENYFIENPTPSQTLSRDKSKGREQSVNEEHTNGDIKQSRACTVL